MRSTASRIANAAPAGRADLRGVEEDERIVADPAAVAAGVVELGLDAERSQIHPAESLTVQ